MPFKHWNYGTLHGCKVTVDETVDMLGFSVYYATVQWGEKENLWDLFPHIQITPKVSSEAAAYHDGVALAKSIKDGAAYKVAAE